MTLSLRYAARSDVGLIRSGNEDAVYAGPRLLAVADGMGGHAAGEVASAVTISTLRGLDEDVPSRDLVDALADTVAAANEQLRAMVDADRELEGMGTTLTALLWSGQRLALAHIGDSRAYLYRDGELHQLTRDHTLVQELVDEGRLSAEDASHHPQRSMLTRALMGTGHVEPDVSVREAHVGDRYLLCTDGLSGVLSAETMAKTLAEPDPQAAADQLVDLALRGGGPDNITVIVADVVDSSHPDAAPVVAGAAADGPAPAPRTPDTPAGRAAAVRRLTRPLRERHAPPAAYDEHDGPPRRRWWLMAIGLVAVAALLVAGWFGLRAYVQSQWYVGSADGNVAIYQGVTGTVAGIDFTELREVTDLPVDTLPEYQRGRVAQGIEVGSLAEAYGVVNGLRDEQQCPDPDNPACEGSLVEPPAGLTEDPSPGPPGGGDTFGTEEAAP